MCSNRFSLKNKEDSERFLEVLENYYRDNKRLDAMFVRDVSSAQRKWIYNTLEEKGFSKKRLYRLKTTFSKR
jgi:RAB protein geranylgeranyltransferase component A